MSYPRPNRDGSLGGLEPGEATRSLAAEMAEVVDEARQVVADLGLRPYRVFSVIERWDSGVVGRGSVETVLEREIVPPPHVDFEPLSRSYQAAGTVERGEVVLRAISARYTEAEIFALLRPVATPGEAAYVEVVGDGRNGDGELPKRRRFVLTSVPYLDANRFEWIVKMRPQDNARRPDRSLRHGG